MSSVLCIGSVLVDELYFSHTRVLAGTSNPASYRRAPGGVVGNVARHLARLGVSTSLLTVWGNDSEAGWLRSVFDDDSIEVSLSVCTDRPTGRYVSVLQPDGELYTAACSDTIDTELTIPYLESKRVELSRFGWIVADTNLHTDVIAWLIGFCRTNEIRLVIEPVSVAKSAKLRLLDLTLVELMTPNLDELASVSDTALTDELESAMALLSRGVRHVWIRKGANGSRLISRESDQTLDAPHIPVVDSTGAGDAALAGWLCVRLRDGSELDSLKAGHAMAALVLQEKGASVPGLTWNRLNDQIKLLYP